MLSAKSDPVASPPAHASTDPGVVGLCVYGLTTWVTPWPREHVTAQ